MFKKILDTPRICRKVMEPGLENVQERETTNCQAYSPNQATDHPRKDTTATPTEDLILQLPLSLGVELCGCLPPKWILFSLCFFHPYLCLLCSGLVSVIELAQITCKGDYITIFSLFIFWRGVRLCHRVRISLKTGRYLAA